MTAQSVQHIGRLRDDHAARDIAFRLGIAPADVTPDHRFHLGIGAMDEGSTCVLWMRDYHPPAPAAAWSAPLPSLLTEGSEGDG